LLPRMKRIVFSIVPLLLLAFAAVFTGPGCANIIPPSGGPRDSLPPVLLTATPPDSSTNFRAGRIVLTFDEYIDLQEVQQNLLFTPIFESNPVVEARLRTITVRLRDTLEANTTYTFNFGNAIRDFNENNILRNFDYTFSTGPYLDSLTLSGNVKLAENGAIDTTLQVVLHRNLDDSAIVKERPRYAARVDRNGAFTFRNLPPGTFAIYALGDAGSNRRYQSKSQLFAFANNPVAIADSVTPVTLWAYREAPVTPATAASSSGTPRNAADRRLRFTTNLSGNQQSLLDSLVFTFERPLRTFDSAQLSLHTDSTFTPVQAYTTTLDSTRKRLALHTAWQPGTAYHLILNPEFAADTLGFRLPRRDTLSFTARKVEDYGRITLRLRNIDTTQNPVLQFVQSDKVVFSASVKSGLFRQTLFPPGDYTLRILYDTNGNGVWDPGQFFGTKKQPEIVWPISQTINVKPAWDNEFERSLQ
jgi:uncharacterized protein (DUF2141 family)